MLLAQASTHHDAEREVLVTGGGDGTIKVWYLEGLANAGLGLLYKFKNPSASVMSLACNEVFLYAGLASGRVNVYNLDSQQLIQRINVGPEDVTALQIVDGVAFCGTSDGFLKVGAKL